MSRSPTPFEASQPDVQPTAGGGASACALPTDDAAAPLIHVHLPYGHSLRYLHVAGRLTTEDEQGQQHVLGLQYESELRDGQMAVISQFIRGAVEEPAVLTPGPSQQTRARSDSAVAWQPNSPYASPQLHQDAETKEAEHSNEPTSLPPLETEAAASSAPPSANLLMPVCVVTPSFRHRHHPSNPLRIRLVILEHAPSHASTSFVPLKDVVQAMLRPWSPSSVDLTALQQQYAKVLTADVLWALGDYNESHRMRLAPSSTAPVGHDELLLSIAGFEDLLQQPKLVKAMETHESTYPGLSFFVRGTLLNNMRVMQRGFSRFHRSPKQGQGKCDAQSEEELEVHKILKRAYGSDGELYQVWWCRPDGKPYPRSDPEGFTWEPLSFLTHCPDKLREFEESLARKSRKATPQLQPPPHTKLTAKGKRKARTTASAAGADSVGAPTQFQSGSSAAAAAQQSDAGPPPSMSPIVQPAPLKPAMISVPPPTSQLSSAQAISNGSERAAMPSGPAGPLAEEAGPGPGPVRPPHRYSSSHHPDAIDLTQ